MKYYSLSILFILFSYVGLFFLPSQEKQLGAAFPPFMQEIWEGDKPLLAVYQSRDGLLALKSSLQCYEVIGIELKGFSYDVPKVLEPETKIFRQYTVSEWALHLLEDIPFDELVKKTSEKWRRKVSYLKYVEKKSPQFLGIHYTGANKELIQKWEELIDEYLKEKSQGANPT